MTSVESQERKRERCTRGSCGRGTRLQHPSHCTDSSLNMLKLANQLLLTGLLLWWCVIAQQAERQVTALLVFLGYKLPPQPPAPSVELGKDAHGALVSQSEQLSPCVVCVIGIKVCCGTTLGWQEAPVHS